MRNLLKSIAFMCLVAISVAANATEKGIFWKMESPEGNVSYLFGTMHSDDNRIVNFAPNVEEALKASDLFLMEAEPLANPSTLMMDNDLSSYLNQHEFDKVRELADFHSMHIGAAMRMKPWLLAIIFDLPKPQAGFEQDNILMARAEELGKEAKGIETGAEHFGVMDSFSIDEQLIMLRAVLKRTQEQKEKDFERLMSAYLSGDSDRIVKLDEQITGGMLPPELWRRMRVKLLDERNTVMAERTIAKAKQGKVFVAVGAAHLAGKGGLVQAFKDAGFKLTPLSN